MKKIHTPLLSALALMIAMALCLQGCGSQTGSSDNVTTTWEGFDAAEEAAEGIAEWSTPAVTPEPILEPMIVQHGSRKNVGHSINGSDSKPLALAKPGDDIWVIVKPPKRDPEQPQDLNSAEPPLPGAGAGAMVAIVPPHDDDQAEPRLVPMPLKHTKVHADVAGYIATVDVQQRFHNPFASKIVAVYQFPLPQDAAVSEFVMEVGPPEDRRQIRGIIREKEEAERIYRQARAQGFNASLLSQVRPNIFEQKVANIEPGKQIDIHIRYFNTLSYHDGWYQFVFPMVVGPRFNPPGTGNAVEPVARGSVRTQRSGGGTAISYLRPEERSGHDIELTLSVDAGVTIEDYRCTTHDVLVDQPEEGGNTLRADLSPNDAIPNKDFVFAFRVVGETMKSGLVTHVDEQGRGFFTLMLYPPADLDELDRQPMEMVFVLDCSGSMSGEPMAQSKDAIRHALQQLRPTDTFQVIRFSNDASQLGPKPLPATRENIRKAIDYVDSLSGTGGTMMVEGIKAALDFPHDPAPGDIPRYRVVTFLTDGYIGNEKQILHEMDKRIGDARVFSFGVGSSTNRYLMERMAKVGRGAAAYLLPGNNGQDIMDLYFERISRPAMTDVSISFGAAEVAQVYPSRTPDLLVGRPVILTGRYGGELSDIRITGKAAGQPIAITIDTDQAAQHDALAPVWARRKIADMMDQMALNGDSELKPAVLSTALEYNLVSQYTSFIAVDATRRTAGDSGTTLHQALPMPEGVRYDTTVQD